MPLPTPSNAEPRGPRLAVLVAAGTMAEAERLARVLQAESVGAVEAIAVGSAAEACARLADRPVDALLAHHDADRFDAIALVEAAAAAGACVASVVVGVVSPAAIDDRCLAAGADYRRLDQATPASLLAVLRHAVARHRQQGEHRRLAGAEQARLGKEHAEAQRLLAEQRRLIDQLESIGDVPKVADAGSLTPWLAGTTPSPTCPAEAAAQRPAYRELLRAFAMSSQGLTDAMATLADRLSAAGVGGRQAVALHVSVLEEVTTGLGARSARHVISRADLMLTELLVHLADGYRRRYGSQSATTPPRTQPHPPPPPNPPPQPPVPQQI
ncbi:MAG: hypothetical protein AAGJ46_15080, partial [Planctomycetota bacterium]